MKGKILRFGVDNRDHLVNFLEKFYKRHAIGVERDQSMTPEILGKNWSCFVYEREGKNFLCLFDGDDGSGGTPADCKLVWPKFQSLIDHYKINDYLIFKIQHTPRSDQKQFYPFKTDVYPFALMTNDPERIFRIADSLPKVEQDIDVLFVGGRVHERNKPYCWAKHRNTNQHWPTNRLIGYEKLLEIKRRRTDLNIVAVDGLLPADQYYETVNRAKICLDFPGIGVSSRKFYEYLVLGKCILALPQNNCCWPLKEWEHYAALRTIDYQPDYNYDQLESNIDHLLSQIGIRTDVGRRAAKLRSLVSHEAVGDYVVRTLDEFAESCLDGTIRDKRVEYK